MKSDKNQELINAISKITKIKEDKIVDYSKKFNPINILQKPNTIDPTEKELDKINTLNDLIINYSIIKDFAKEETISFSSNEDVANYFVKLLGRYKDKERMYGAFLDKNNQVIDIKKISEGTIDATLFSPREVVKEVIRTNCKSVVFSHNHPSGSIKPSNRDKDMTKRIDDILEPLGIKVLDHVIVGDNDYTSLKDMHILNSSREVHNFIKKDLNKDSSSTVIYDRHISNFTKSLCEILDTNIIDLNYILRDNDLKDEELSSSEKIISIIENPDEFSKNSKLNKEQYRKLKALSYFVKQQEITNSKSDTYDLIFRDPRSIHEPCLKGKLKDNKEGLMIIYLNTKLKVITIDEITEQNNGELEFNPRKLLKHTLGNEAVTIIPVHKIKNQEMNLVAEQGRQISQRLLNIFKPMGINVIDYVMLEQGTGRSVSLKEKGLMPYGTFGKADYSTIKIQNIDKPLYKEYEDEEEWDLEL